jgi:outer membrane protein OmpA-like peptidoglycan-associated protein
MKLNLRTILLLASAPIALAACDNADLAMKTVSPDPADHPHVAEPTSSQMVEEASGRKRVRDLRSEVTGNIAYLRSHLGQDRAYILDMQDSLMVTIPGAGAFEGRTARLSQSGIDAVARVAASMEEFPHSRITIIGHVIGSKSDYADQILSERRAVAVKSVLMSRGIDECRLGLMGKGSDDHVAAPVTDRRNQFNDRIEIMMKPFQDGACV